jgi:tetratricopeptide (TPR) repeat protein
MKLTHATLLLLLFLSLNNFSQNMQIGFTYLETGNYKQAEVFFKDVLKKYPTNKTARLCYGRAIGLLGQAEQAVQLFTHLLADYPLDFEVKLNYGESLLWNKNYQDAKLYYKALVAEDEKSFPALLGFANTLSNLKEFEEALIYADKALEILPENPNAMVSKKYMRLGLANKLVSNQEYDIAEVILIENLTFFKEDKETLLNLANLYLISEQIDTAIKTYEILGEKPENNLISLNGIALAYHLKL